MKIKLILASLIMMTATVANAYEQNELSLLIEKGFPKEGPIEIMKEFIENGGDITQPIKHKEGGNAKTILQVIDFRRYENLKFILENGADKIINKGSSSFPYDTPLWSTTDPKIAKLLLEHGASINIRDFMGNGLMERKLQYHPAVGKIILDFASKKNKHND